MCPTEQTITKRQKEKKMEWKKFKNQKNKFKESKEMSCKLENQGTEFSFFINNKFK